MTSSTAQDWGAQRVASRTGDSEVTAEVTAEGHGHESDEESPSGCWSKLPWFDEVGEPATEIGLP